MPALFSGFAKAARRPEILAICFVVFLADVSNSFVIPTLSLYAQSLGASLALIGLISSFVNVVSTLVAVPIGLLSDQRGRRWVITGGILCFALSSFLYTLVSNPYWLFPVRMIAGIAGVATFTISVAYLSDRVRNEDRGPAIGLFSTSMGLGFTIGPLMAGWVAEGYGYHGSYRLAALIALVGVFVAHRTLQGEPEQSSTVQAMAATGSFTQRLRLLTANPGLLAACLINLSSNLIFNIVFSFVPLLAAGLGHNEAVIGSLFAGRGLSSTLSRLPTGLLSSRFGTRTLILLSMALSTAVLIGLARPTLIPLASLLVLEGIAYGMMLTAGYAYLGQQTERATRGVATGLYGMFGSLGGAVGPLVMGLVADVWGLQAVFWCSAGVVAGLLGVIGWMGQVQREKN